MSGIVDALLKTEVAQRIGQHIAAERRGEFSGSADIGGRLPVPQRALLNAAGLAGEGVENVGKALVGQLAAEAGAAQAWGRTATARRPEVQAALLAASLIPGLNAIAAPAAMLAYGDQLGRFDPLARGPVGREDAAAALAAYTTTDGNPFARARAANEGAAAVSPYAIGAADLALDPSNYAGGIITKARRAGRIENLLAGAERAIAERGGPRALALGREEADLLGDALATFRGRPAATPRPPERGLDLRTLLPEDGARRALSDSRRVPAKDRPGDAAGPARQPTGGTLLDLLGTVRGHDAAARQLAEDRALVGDARAAFGGRLPATRPSDAPLDIRTLLPPDPTLAARRPTPLKGRLGDLATPANQPTRGTLLDELGATPPAAPLDALSAADEALAVADTADPFAREARDWATARGRETADDPALEQGQPRETLTALVAGAEPGTRRAIVRDLAEANYGSGWTHALNAALGTTDIRELGDRAPQVVDWLAARTQLDATALDRLVDSNPDLYRTVNTLADPPESALAMQNALRENIGRPLKGAPQTGAAPDVGGDLAAGGGLGSGVSPAALLGNPTVREATAGALAGATSANLEALAAGEDIDPATLLTRTLAGAGSGAAGGAGLRGLRGQIGEKGLGAVARAPVTTLLDALPDTQTTVPWQVAHRRGLAAQRAGMDTASDSPLGGLGGIWKGQAVQTIRNNLQDIMGGRVFVGGAQGFDALKEIPTLRRSAAYRLELPTEYERYAQPVQDVLEATGFAGTELKLGGQGLLAAEQDLDRVNSALKTSVAEGAMAALNPAALMTGTALPAAAWGAVKGYTRPYQAAVFKTLNTLNQEVLRQAVFLDEFTKALPVAYERFRPKLAAAGLDPAALPDDGRFGPADLKALGARPELIEQWDRYRVTVKDGAEQRARFVLGDYTKKEPGDMSALDKLEQRLGGVIPFISWPRRAWPVVGEMMANHPGVALAAIGLGQASAQQAAAAGLPGYLAVNVGAHSETPVIGPLIQELLGGQEGTAYVNPLAAVSPVPGELFAVKREGEKTGERTGYQRLDDLVSRAGFSFNPAVQALAYATGQDYRGPGPLSRTAGLEGALPEVGPNLPPLGKQGLDAARALLTPAVQAAGLPVAGVYGDPGRPGYDPLPDYDPVQRRAAELVLERTGKPLTHPDNRSYLRQLGDPESALYREAEAGLRSGGRAKNVVSLVSPVGVVTQGDTALEARRARTGLPHSYNAMQLLAAAGDKRGLERAKAENAAYVQANPAAETYRGATPSARRALLLADWDARHGVLKKHAPREYTAARQAYEAEIMGGK